MCGRRGTEDRMAKKKQKLPNGLKEVPVGGYAGKRKALRASNEKRVRKREAGKKGGGEAIR